MSNYIDRNILLEELNEMQIEGDEYYQGLGRAKQIVCDQPTVDVEEVRRGKWIYCGHHEMMRHVFQCSVCGRWMFTNSPECVVEEYPYCHCGAKMMGDNENEALYDQICINEK